SLILRHCARADATVCHTHPVQNWTRTASGNFVAPDHEYPSHLELSLTAVDQDGLSTTETVPLYPRTVALALASDPPGMQLSLDSDTLTAPFTETVIAKSVNTITAADPQGFGDGLFRLTRWSDELAATHSVNAPATGSASYTATYARP